MDNRKLFTALSCRGSGSEIQPDPSIADGRDSDGQSPSTATKASSAVFTQFQQAERLMSSMSAGPRKDPENPGDGYFDPLERHRPGALSMYCCKGEKDINLAFPMLY